MGIEVVVQRDADHPITKSVLHDCGVVGLLEAELHHLNGIPI